jgi:hypothetical protein
VAGTTDTARAIVAYLRELRPILSAPRGVRRDWIRDVGLIIEESRAGDPIALARRAGRLGHNVQPVFRESRRRLAEVAPPPECMALHEAIGVWIERHLTACEALIRADDQRSLRPLRDVQEQLGEARVSAGRFNAEYLRLADEVRSELARALGRPVGHAGRDRSRALGRVGAWIFGRASN